MSIIQKNGLEESLYVFFEQNDLPSRWQVDKNFTICELGFGTGLNFLLAVDKWNKHTKNSWLNFISIENEPLSKSDLNKSLSRWDSLSKFKEQLLNKYPLLVPGFHRLLFSRVQNCTDSLPGRCQGRAATDRSAS